MGLFGEEAKLGKVQTVSQEPIEDLPPHQVNSNSTILDSSSSSSKVNQADSTIEEFISGAPQATYLIDTSSNKNESLLCRQKPEGGQTCLKLGYHYTELFKQMQRFEYFCALPVHKVEAQYFECSKIK